MTEPKPDTKELSARFLVSVPAEYMERLDNYCEQQGLSRSAVIRRGLDLALPGPFLFQVYTYQPLPTLVYETNVLAEATGKADALNANAGRSDAYIVREGSTTIYPPVIDGATEGMRRTVERIYKHYQGEG